MTELLNVNNLSIASRQGAILTGLSFELALGELLGLIGPSGSGKSLTALAILGLLPEQVHCSTGAIAYRTKKGGYYNLAEVQSSVANRLRGLEIGYVSQDTHAAFNPVQRCGTQLEEAYRKLHPKPKRREVSEGVDEHLERVELGGELGRIREAFPHQLSGGQLQRLQIALALIGRPQLLLADEPTTALDSITEAEVMALIDRIRKESGMGVLLITHDDSLLDRYADRTVSLPVPETTDARRSGSDRMVIQSATISQPNSALTGGLKVKNLQITYEQAPAPTVVDCSFELPDGEYVALVGPSGCGKSTIAKWMVGLQRASRGEIERDTHKVPARLPGNEVRKFTGAQMVFQDILGSLNPTMRVGKAVEEICKLHGKYGVRELFQRVNLDYDSVGRRFPSQLSGGQRQRIALIKALAADPKTLICDEAVAALDPTLRRDMQRLLLRVIDSRGIGLLFITHNLREVIGCANRVLIMEEGRIVEELSAAALTESVRSTTGKRLLMAAGLLPS